MNKRELIDYIESLPCSDDTEVLVAGFDQDPCPVTEANTVRIEVDAVAHILDKESRMSVYVEKRYLDSKELEELTMVEKIVIAGH